MTCCGLERDSQFCPKCGKLLTPSNQGPPRWAKAEAVEGQVLNVQITIYPDRHRIPVTTQIKIEEAELLYQELGVLLGKNESSVST